MTSRNNQGIGLVDAEGNKFFIQDEDLEAIIYEALYCGGISHWATVCDDHDWKEEDKLYHFISNDIQLELHKAGNSEKFLFLSQHDFQEGFIDYMVSEKEPMRVVNGRFMEQDITPEEADKVFQYAAFGGI